MIYKFSIIFALTFVISFSFITDIFAETQYQYSFQNFEYIEEGSDRWNKIYSDSIEISDLSLNQVAYIAGESLEGEFILVNTSDSEINNVFYDIQLVGNFIDIDSSTTTEEFIPTTIFEERTIENKKEPLTLSVGESKKISFSYQIPELVKSKDLGIRVQTYIGGEYLSGDISTRFAITGDETNFLENIAQVQISGRPYDLSSSEVVYRNGKNPFADKRVLFAISLKNDFRSTYNLVPTVEIYDRVVTGNLLNAFEAKNITVKAGGTLQQRIELPVFDYKNGDYVALITYRDSEGIIRSGPFEIRYSVEDTSEIISGVDPTKSLIEKEPVQTGPSSTMNIFIVSVVVFGILIISLLLVFSALNRSRQDSQ